MGILEITVIFALEYVEQKSKSFCMKRAQVWKCGNISDIQWHVLWTDFLFCWIAYLPCQLVASLQTGPEQCRLISSQSRAFCGTSSR